MMAASSPHLAVLAGIEGDIGCSAFVAFAWLSHAERLSPQLARAISADRAAVYDWYLTEYAPQRLPARVPLSDADIAWLMEEVTLPGVAFALPRVVSWAALKPFSEGGRLLAGGDEQGLAAWWADVAAPSMGVEDRLVPGRQTVHEGNAAEVPAPALSVFAADVEVAAPLSRASGLARAAKASIAAFEAAGLRVKATDTSPGQSSSDPDYVPRRVVEGRVPVSTFHINPDALPFVFAEARLEFAPLRVGIFVWELDRPATSDFLGLDLVDEIWAASRYVQGIYDPVFCGRVVHVPPTVPVPKPSDRASDRQRLMRRAGLRGDPFVFLSMFDGLSYLSRKNPLGTIEAFRRAFRGGENVALVLKGHHRPAGSAGPEADVWRRIDAAVAADRRIRLIETTLPHGDVMALVAGADAFVSLHRSEGFGLGPAEAMMRGVPTIVTAYGGTEDFCDDLTALRVRASLVPVQADEYLHAEDGHRWAEPDLGVAASHMRRLFDDRAFCRSLGAAGQVRTLRQFSLDAVAPGYAHAFERLTAGRV